MQNIVQKKNIDPTGFTYFDRLVTRNILDGTPMINQNQNQAQNQNQNQKK